MLEYRRQMLESMTNRPALAGRVLEQHHGLSARARLEGRADRLRDQSQRIRLAPRRARTRMRDHAEQPQCVGAIELVDERGNRLLTQQRKRRRQVDQIAGVGHYRCDSRRVDAPAERADF